MKHGNGNDIYKTAFFLSLAIHIFFITGAEAALILSKKDNPNPSFVFIASLPVIQPKSFTSSVELKKELISDAKSENPVQPKLNRKIKEPAVIQNMREFKSQQSRLSKRINSIKKEIVEKQVELLQSVNSSVYDLEKIPIEMRKSVLPDYLKQMRSKISAVWLLLLDSVQCESCTSVVEYRVDRNGKISGLALLHSSGNQSFDAACLKAVTQSNPLPALPFHFKQEIKEEYLTVSLTFYLERKKPKLTSDPSFGL